MGKQILIDRLLAILAEVDLLRCEQASDAGLRQRVQAIKLFQQMRFSYTYSDLLVSERYAVAARFFIEELYGPGDKSLRDAQFARVVPSVVRLFPSRVAELVESLCSLHLLSERLDRTMAVNLTKAEVDAATYLTAWRATGGVGERLQQLSMAMSIGQTLDELNGKTWLRSGLTVMRPAARAAGLGSLQDFLEAGLHAFGGMNGATEFLQLIFRREKLFIDSLFGTKPIDIDMLRV